MRIPNDKKVLLKVTSDISLTLYNQIVLADSSSNNISVHLPDLTRVSGNPDLTAGYYFEVKKTSSTNSVFVYPPSGQLIDKESVIELTEDNEGIYLKFDGQNYQIVASVIYGSSGSSSFITSVENTNTIDLSVLTGELTANLNYTDSVDIDFSDSASGFTGLLKTTGVTPSAYGNSRNIPTITVDSKGRVTSASNNSVSIGTVSSVQLASGTGISLSGTNPITTSGTITITNSSPDQTVVMNSGSYITVSGTYPTFTITGNPPRLPLILTTSDNSLTSTVSETKVFSQQIAGGTLAAGDLLVMVARFRKIGTAGATATFRFYVNTSDSLSGATLVATSALSGSTNITGVFQRNPACKSSNIIEFWTASSSVFTDMTQTTTAVSNISYTYANAYYWIVSIQMANTADTGILSSFLLERIRL